MKRIFAASISLAFAAVLLPPAAPLFAREPARTPARTAPRQSLNVGAASAYPDTASGLEKLLSDLLAAAKFGDAKQFGAFVTALEIPDSRKWFSRNFGKEQGEIWSGPYSRDLQDNESRFRQFLQQISAQSIEFSVRSVNDDPRPDGGRGLEWDMRRWLQRHVDIYYAGWKIRGTSADADPLPYPYFFFIDGKFRCNLAIYVAQPLRLPG